MNKTIDQYFMKKNENNASLSMGKINDNNFSVPAGNITIRNEQPSSNNTNQINNPFCMNRTVNSNNFPMSNNTFNKNVSDGNFPANKLTNPLMTNQNNPFVTGITNNNVSTNFHNNNNNPQNNQIKNPFSTMNTNTANTINVANPFMQASNSNGLNNYTSLNQQNSNLMNNYLNSNLMSNGENRTSLPNNNNNFFNNVNNNYNNLNNSNNNNLNNFNNLNSINNPRPMNQLNSNSNFQNNSLGTNMQQGTINSFNVNPDSNLGNLNNNLTRAPLNYSNSNSSCKGIDLSSNMTNYSETENLEYKRLNEFIMKNGTIFNFSRSKHIYFDKTRDGEKNITINHFAGNYLKASDPTLLRYVDYCFKNNKKINTDNFYLYRKYSNSSNFTNINTNNIKNSSILETDQGILDNSLKNQFFARTFGNSLSNQNQNNQLNQNQNQTIGNFPSTTHNPNNISNPFFKSNFNNLGNLSNVTSVNKPYPINNTNAGNFNNNFNSSNCSFNMNNNSNNFMSNLQNDQNNQKKDYDFFNENHNNLQSNQNMQNMQNTQNFQNFSNFPSNQNSFFAQNLPNNINDTNIFNRDYQNLNVINPNIQNMQNMQNIQNMQNLNLQNQMQNTTGYMSNPANFSFSNTIQIPNYNIPNISNFTVNLPQNPQQSILQSIPTLSHQTNFLNPFSPAGNLPTSINGQNEFLSNNNFNPNSFLIQTLNQQLPLLNYINSDIYPELFNQKLQEIKKNKFGSVNNPEDVKNFLENFSNEKNEKFEEYLKKQKITEEQEEVKKKIKLLNDIDKMFYDEYENKRYDYINQKNSQNTFKKYVFGNENIKKKFEFPFSSNDKYKYDRFFSDIFETGKQKYLKNNRKDRFSFNELPSQFGQRNPFVYQSSNKNRIENSKNKTYSSDKNVFLSKSKLNNPLNNFNYNNIANNNNINHLRNSSIKINTSNLKNNLLRKNGIEFEKYNDKEWYKNHPDYVNSMQYLIEMKQFLNEIDERDKNKKIMQREKSSMKNTNKVQLTDDKFSFIKSNYDKKFDKIEEVPEELDLNTFLQSPKIENVKPQKFTKILRFRFDFDKFFSSKFELEIDMNIKGRELKELVFNYIKNNNLFSLKDEISLDNLTINTNIGFIFDDMILKDNTYITEKVELVIFAIKGSNIENSKVKFDSTEPNNLRNKINFSPIKIVEESFFDSENSNSKNNLLKNEKKIKKENDLDDYLLKKETNQSAKNFVPRTMNFNTIPPIYQLKDMSFEQLREVENFTVFNKYGKIIFHGFTDITFLDLDQIIEIEHMSISLYQKCNEFPETNEELNKAATLEIYDYMIPDDFVQDNRLVISDEYLDDYRKMVEKSIQEKGGKLLLLDFYDRILIFEVPYFEKK